MKADGGVPVDLARAGLCRLGDRVQDAKHSFKVFYRLNMQGNMYIIISLIYTLQS